MEIKVSQDVKSAPTEVLVVNQFEGEKTSVELFDISDEEIRDYIASGEPFDKAGAYGIQGLFARYIKGIEGDYNNVVGLPVGRLYQELKKYDQIYCK